jgi:hypothetical protein
VTARSDQTPQPGKRRRQDVEQPDNAIGRAFAGACRCTNAKAANIDRYPCRSLILGTGS